MEEMRFDIRHPDGRTESIIAQAARIVLGSGAHCDVRLAVDQAAFEHVVVEMMPDAARIRRVAREPATLDGLPFQVAPLGPVARLVIGGTTIGISRSAVAPQEQSTKLGAANVAKGLVVAGLLGTILAVANASPAGPARAPDKMPELFSDIVTTCPRQDAREAFVVAEDERALGEGARERSPFDAREAIASVKAYETAAACYRLAHADGPAADAAATGRELRESTVLDFRARRVRLERLLAVKDYELARKDVAVLRALTSGLRGEYVAWLAKVDQDLKNQRVETSR